MRWTPGYSSDDVEDRRDEQPAAAGLGGGGAPIGILFWLFSRFGVPGLLVGGVVLYLASNLGSSEPAPARQPAGANASAAGDPQHSAVEFVSFVLDDVQKSWGARFAQSGKTYTRARLVLFNRAIRSGCGIGQDAMGPFYCPRDTKVYIDLSFYQELRDRFGAPGDFAQAYVIAHEIGHHVQHLLGLDQKVDGAHGAQGELGGSVRLELQADCLAGIWAQSTEQRGLLESGDIDEALKAASAIGDDRLQRQSGGRVQPETWTHGSSAERVRWFKRGYELGALEACDTFNAQRL
jgi:predicted metalloprotease